MTYNGSENLSEADVLERNREERRQIVTRYDQGREDGTVIDDWEDPKLEIYHTQDRFGFIHDQRLPATLGRTEKEKKQLEKEMSRVDKWVVMVDDKNKAKWFPFGSKHHEKMVDRVWKGVPERMRGHLWKNLLDLDRIKKEQEGKYEEMKKVARLHSPDIRQIDLDVNRTYRNHIMFRERYNTRQQDLFHVLAAYSMYNSEVGYCQGMSQIAALLLMYLETDEDAFWALSQLMVGRRFNMHGFFIPHFPKLLRFQEHHDKILMKKLRKLQKHLIANNVDTGIYTLKWFFQCFLDRIPFSLTIRVWDIYLLVGEKIMFAMAYSILKLHRKTLLKMGMDDLLEFLQKTMETDFGFDDDYVIDSLKDNLVELRSSGLLTAGHIPEALGPIPEAEKPQKPFGLLDIPTEKEEITSSTRRPTTTQEMKFSRDTAIRGEENAKTLRHLNSQTSIDDGSMDQSLNETGSFEDPQLYLAEHEVSLESPSTPTPSDRTVSRGAPFNNNNRNSDVTSNHLPPSPLPSSREQDELDDSLIYMMKQVGVNQRNDKRVTSDVRRPASADPGGGSRAEGVTVNKRLSAFGDLRSQSRSSGLTTSESTNSQQRIGGQENSSSQDTSRLSNQDMSRLSSQEVSRMSSQEVSRLSSQDNSRFSRTSSEMTGGLGSSRGTGLNTSIESSGREESNQSLASPRLRRMGSGGVNKGSSGRTYFYGESPHMTNGQDGHLGEVVRIRVPYSDNIDKDKNSRFNGHKVTIQVNQGDGESEAGHRSSNKSSSTSHVSKRHLSSREKKVSGTEIHTTTHSMYVAEQNRSENTEQNGTKQYRRSLNESYSSTEGGDTRHSRNSRGSASEYSESKKNRSDYRKETFF